MTDKIISKKEMEEFKNRIKDKDHWLHELYQEYCKDNRDVKNEKEMETTKNKA